MQKPLDSLIALLDLEELEVNIFRGVSPEGDSQRVFGGQVLGQALVAAGRTVAAGLAHSFHAYFLRPGDPTRPILYQVDRTRDGRAFTTRRVIAIQHGRAIFHLEASFHRPEAGHEHQDSMPDVPDPESLPTWHDRLEPLLEHAPEDTKRWMIKARPIDSRHVTFVNPIEPEKLPPRLLVWIRADGMLPFDAGRFDTVVTTWTLCSIADHRRALDEMRRVLRPGGRYLFIEHGRAPAERTARWQDRVNPLWRRLTGGCNMNRPIDLIVQEGGFELERLARFRHTGPGLLAHMYRGVAKAV